MSRIQDILKKAERDGALHRTRGLTPDVPPVVHASPMAPTTVRATPRMMWGR